MMPRTSSELFELCNDVNYKGRWGKVMPIGFQLETTAFFPGGYGCWNEDGCLEDCVISEKEIMVVDYIFGTCENHRATAKTPGQNLKKGLWVELKKIYEAIDRDLLTTTFFTNLYLGVFERGNKKENRPNLPVAGEYFDKCKRCFNLQLQAQRPKNIIVLGSGSKTVFEIICGERLKSYDNGDCLPKICNDGYVANVAYVPHPNRRNTGENKYVKGEKNIKAIEIIKTMLSLR
jgi:hypothetical protein